MEEETLCDQWREIEKDIDEIQAINATIEALEKIVKKLSNQQDIDHEIVKMVDEHFWELI